VSEPAEQNPSWRLATFALWIVFFAVGLLPESVYYTLREAGSVTTQDALINSPYFITVALAAFLGYFSWNRSREELVPEKIAWRTAAQNGIVALLAFLPLPLGLLNQVAEVPLPGVRRFIYGIAALKLGAWGYLFVLMSLYYALGNGRVFAWVAHVFPIAGTETKVEAETAPNPVEEDEKDA